MRKLIILSLLILNACNFAPYYRRPPTCPDCSWRVKSDSLTTEANIRFWESLSDPILNALIVQALHYNRDLKVAAWRVAEFFGNYLEVRSAQYPQINFNAIAMKERFSQVDLPASLTNAITPFYAFQFSFSYEVDFWGLYRNQTEAACDELLAEVENRRTVVLSLVSAVAQGYIFLRQLDAQLQISYKTMKARKEAMEIARERFVGGLTSEIEWTQAVSLFDQAQASVVILEQQIPIQENLLSILVGANPTAIWRGREVDEFTYPCTVPAGLPSELLLRRPDILQAEFFLKASNAQIGVARAAFFPQISLTGLIGGESFQLNKLFSTPYSMWQIGGQIAQPLYTGGFLSGQLIEAIAKNREAYFQYQQTVLQAFKEVNDALIAHTQAFKLVKVQEDRVKDLKIYLELAWLRYYEGQADYVTVLNASTELFNDELLLAEAQANIFLTLVDIYKAVGGGWVLDADCVIRKN